MPPFYRSPLMGGAKDLGPSSSDGSLVPRVEEVDFLGNRS